MTVAASVEFPKEPSRDLFHNAEITCHLKVKERLPRVFAERLRRDREERNQSALFIRQPVGLGMVFAQLGFQDTLTDLPVLPQPVLRHRTPRNIEGNAMLQRVPEVFEIFEPRSEFVQPAREFGLQ